MERKFIAMPKDRKNSDGKEDFSLVEIKGTPNCKIHGAMNSFSNGIWRCFSEYGQAEPTDGDTVGKFIDRVCNACCFEIITQQVGEEIPEISMRKEDSPQVAFKKGQQWKLFKITNYLKEKVKDRVHNIKICHEGIELNDHNLEYHIDCKIIEEGKLGMLNQIIEQITPSKPKENNGN